MGRWGASAFVVVSLAGEGAAAGRPRGRRARGGPRRLQRRRRPRRRPARVRRERVRQGGRRRRRRPVRLGFRPVCHQPQDHHAEHSAGSTLRLTLGCLLGQLDLPLNLDQNRHNAFHGRLKELRAQARQRARELSTSASRVGLTSTAANDGAPKRPQLDRRATTEPRFGKPRRRLIELLKRVSQDRPGPIVPGRAGAGWHGSPTGWDVRVQPEEVGGVVLVFERHQPFVVVAVGGPYPVLAFLPQVVHILGSD